MNAEFFITTPPGRGAIAVVTLFAENVRGFLDGFFHPKSGKNLCDAPDHRIVYGSLDGEDGLVCPISKNELEIHCHGSSAAVGRIAEFLESRGATRIDFRTWCTRTSEGKTGNQRRALEILPLAPTERTARILWDQWNGALERAVSRGEDVTCWDALARHLVEPWRVVLVGKPNVGKSSIFNRLLGFSRAIVYPQPGTTRDLLRERTVLDGWPVEIIDTAGLHDTENPIETQGIQRALEEISRADLILWIRTQDVEDAELTQSRKILEVWNKSDLAPQPGKISVSALTGDGLDTLLSEIVRHLVPHEPAPGTGMRLGY